MLDTEDATLASSESISDGPWYPTLALDLRNGDFVRGAYDDDRADLHRLPVHAQVGLAVELAHDREGQATGWLVARSSNGFHRPQSDELEHPRAWYESNNLLALVTTLAPGLQAGVAYTVKSSPNGISATTQEASATAGFERAAGWGSLKPTLVITTRTKGDRGLYTQAGAEPGWRFGSGETATRLSLPLALGVGWGGFYQAGSGTRLFGHAGLALQQPVWVGDTCWNARAEALALVRDRRLAQLSGPAGETGRVVPLVTVSLATVF